MNILHKIEQLMQTNHIKNKRQLSELSGIPYSTIAGFYTKGYDKMKLSTLKSLANFFNVSIDYLGRDEIVDPDYGKFILKPASTDYSPDEQKLIDNYRTLNDQGKEYILSCMDTALLAYSENPAERVLYIARSGDQGEVHIAKDAQEEALRALDESSDPDL